MPTIRSAAAPRVGRIQDRRRRRLESDKNLLQEAEKLLLEARTRDWEQQRRLEDNAESVSGQIASLEIL